jgi:hypothetical protein
VGPGRIAARVNLRFGDTGRGLAILVGTVPPFSELIAATTCSAAHLESRDAYTPDDPAFLAWKAGRPVPVPAGAAWYDLVREHTARGITFRSHRQLLR